MSYTGHFKDLSGLRFGRLVAIERSGVNRHHQSMWKCKCDCGKYTVVMIANLQGSNPSQTKKRTTKSCGCLKREATVNALFRHGGTHTSEYRTYKAIGQRCYNPNNPSYDNYGGRGIRMCNKWRKSFLSFVKDMGPKPSPFHTVDRINPNGNYAPSNCRWATRLEQANNKRCTRKFHVSGEVMSMKETADHFNISYDLLKRRIKSGMTLKQAIETPKRPKSKITKIFDLNRTIAKLESLGRSIR